jgi:hypothetical protein
MIPDTDDPRFTEISGGSVKYFAFAVIVAACKEESG